jgi:hypothetical protein
LLRLLPVALLAVVPGCERSSTPDVAPLALRGEPINSPLALSNAVNQKPAAPDPAPTVSSVSDTVTGTSAPPLLIPLTNPPALDQPKQGDYLLVGFDKLSGYNFEVSDEILNPPTNNLAKVKAKTDGQIPTAVKALNSQRVALKGFMLPLRVEGGLVTELLIMKDQSMCCYGAVPKINEWVSVKMAGSGVRPIMDQPVTLYGKLRIGEARENGYLVGIYAMDGDRMDGPAEN